VPLGPIHLIAQHATYDTEATMYCGAADVIAAIHRDRVPEYAWELICPVCINNVPSGTRGSVGGKNNQPTVHFASPHRSEAPYGARGSASLAFMCSDPVVPRGSRSHVHGFIWRREIDLDTVGHFKGERHFGPLERAFQLSNSSRKGVSHRAR
jgi:hypothetical protein